MPNHLQKGFISVLLILIIILAAVGGLFYYGVTKGNLLKTSDPNLDTTQKFDEQMDQNQTNSSIPPTTNPNQPSISTPQPNTKISSPFTVKGAAPSNWFFEGQIHLKLVDANKKVIAGAAGTEVTPGSWMEEEPVNFEGTIQFSTTAKNGFLIIENDNPSGLPENQKSYEMPVNF
jgi:type II secretory pathway pseudopilin PulG